MPNAEPSINNEIIQRIKKKYIYLGTTFKCINEVPLIYPSTSRSSTLKVSGLINKKRKGEKRQRTTYANTSACCV